MRGPRICLLFTNSSTQGCCGKAALSECPLPLNSSVKTCAKVLGNNERCSLAPAGEKGRVRVAIENFRRRIAPLLPADRADDPHAGHWKSCRTDGDIVPAVLAADDAGLGNAKDSHGKNCRRTKGECQTELSGNLTAPFQSKRSPLTAQKQWKKHMPPGRLLAETRQI